MQGCGRFQVISFVASFVFIALNEFSLITLDILYFCYKLRDLNNSHNKIICLTAIGQYGFAFAENGSLPH